MDKLPVSLPTRILAPLTSTLRRRVMRRTRRTPPRATSMETAVPTITSSVRPAPPWRRSSPPPCRAGSSPPRPRTGGRGGSGRRCRARGWRPSRRGCAGSGRARGPCWARAGRPSQRAHLLEGPVAHEAGAVGRAHHRVVEGVDHVVPGVAAQELADERIRDLLRGHELHLLAGGDGAELLEREDAVLARVDEHAVQGAARGRPAGAVEGAEGGPGDERLRARGIHVVEGHGAAAPEDLAVADALPGDGGRRLDLLGDGAAGRARHQE